MTKIEYTQIENYMKNFMGDSSHDVHHIYRVLNQAVLLAEGMDDIDYDVLIAACLLHDIGRKKQFEDLNLCHAEIGSGMAYEYLISAGWPEDKALHVKSCISTHRFRRDNPPKSVEAKLLFDADKLDVIGAIGIARLLMYGGLISEPLYVFDENGEILLSGGGAEVSSFFQEYEYKQKNLISSFYTEKAKSLASERQKFMESFRCGLYDEITENYKLGRSVLDKLIRISN